LKGVRLNLIGVSDWISEQCQRSRLFQSRTVKTIANAVNPRRFYPVARTEARSRLGIPPEARVIAFAVSGNAQDTRKGHDIAVKALRDLGDLNLFILPMGITPEGSELKTALGSHNGLMPRHISDDAMLRDYYSAADVVWHPSRADTSSMVALEAFACGTPVIAAAVGGVPEVLAGGAGSLIPAEDPAALGRLTVRFFQDRGIFECRDGSNNTAGTLKNFNRFLDHHEKFYRAIRF
jgi:glycosyltransferase involved in cell wall biosynthesis